MHQHRLRDHGGQHIRPLIGQRVRTYDAVVDATGNVYIADNGINRMDAILQQFDQFNFSESSVDNISGDSPQSILFQNIGNQTLNATGPGLVFTDPDFYQVAGSGTLADCTSTFSLTAGAACNVSIDFDPLSGGSLSGSAVFTDNALNTNPNTTQTVPFSGSGIRSTFTIGGSVSGFVGSGLVLQDNGGDNLPISGNGSFTFATAINTGNPYGVTVLSSPVAQNCEVTGGSGTVANAKITSVVVTCTNIPSYGLSVTEIGSGTGTVTSLDTSISCGSGSSNGCSGSYASGTSVTLTAIAGGNSIFAGWGGACSGASACTVTMTSAMSVSASFVAPGPSQSGVLKPISAGVVYGQHGSFTSTNPGGVSANTLADPAGSILDSNGNLYVGDTGSNRVLFYPAGSTTATRVYGQGGSFTTVGNNQGGISANSLNNPYSLALDSSDNLYVADLLNSRVLFYPAGSTTATRVYGQGGSFTTKGANNGGISANTLNQPYGVALDSSGNLYIADTSNNRVLFYPSGSTTATRVYGQGGSFTTSTVNNGGSANGLRNPLGLTLDSSGDLYVADELNNRVLFYPAGSTTATRVYGQGGSLTTNAANQGGISANSLYQPYGTSLDSSGDLYIGDTFNNRVLFYPFASTTATRVYGQLGSFTSNSSNPGGVSANTLVDPEAVPLDSSGNLYVADYGNNRVVEYGPFGSVNVCPSHASTPAPCNNTITYSYYAAAQTTFGTPKVVTQGATGLDFTLASGSTCTGTVSAGNTCAVNVDFAPHAPGGRNGAVLLTDGSGNALGTSYLSGIGTGPQGLFDTAPQTVSISGLNVPRGLSTDGNGNLYAFETSGSVGSIDEVPAGTSTKVQLASVPVADNSGATAVDGAGNLYVIQKSLSGSNDILFELAGGTGPAVQVASIPAADNNLEIDGAGNLYFSDYGSSNVGAIYEMPAGTSQVTTLIAGGLGRRFIGMAIDAAGNLFAVDYSGNTLYEVPAHTTSLQTLVSGGYLSGADAVAVDPAGNIYVANHGGGSVIRYAAGTYAATLLPEAGESGIALDSAGNMYTIATDSSIAGYMRTQASPMTFPNPTAVGTTSDSLQGDIFENDGNAGLVITGYSAAAPFGLGGPQNTCAIGTLASGATCVVGATFTPTASTTVGGTGTITDNNLDFPGTTQTISLSGTGAGAVVPAVLGDTLAAATTSITGSGLTVGTVTYQSSTVPIGEVVSQSPIAGTQVTVPSSVSLVFSTGEPVPSVVNQTQSAAGSSITGVGLMVGTVTTQFSDTVLSGNVISQSPDPGTAVNGGTPVSLVVSSGVPPASDQLFFVNNYFVTGDYASAGITLHGAASGTITIPDSTTSPGTQGVPDGADIIDGFLYWTTIETSATPSGNTGTFLGYSITGQQIGSDVPNYSDGTYTGTLRVYRADVNNYFQVLSDWNGARQGSGPFTVTLPNSGGTITEGASLVVIWRVLSPNFPLKSVVIYNGSIAPTSATGPIPQAVQGFYDAVGGASGTGEVTHLYTSGGSWNDSESSQTLGYSNQYIDTLTTGNAYAAVILSTPVNNSDNDGILDAWKDRARLYRREDRRMGGVAGRNARRTGPVCSIRLHVLRHNRKQHMRFHPAQSVPLTGRPGQRSTGDGHAGIRQIWSASPSQTRKCDS